MRSRRRANVGLFLRFVACSCGLVLVAVVTAGDLGAAARPSTSEILFDNGDAIWTVRADGTSLRKLVSGGVSGPSWSSDGLRIAFTSTRTYELGSARLWVINADGTGKRLLTNYPVDFGGIPSWSPDGRTIAFVREIERCGPGANGACHYLRPVWTVHADGTQPRPVTSGIDGYGPSWSPDGERIAYETECLPPPTCPYGSAIGLADTHRSGHARGLHILFSVSPQDGLVGMPSWSPAGNRIAFAKDTSLGPRLLVIAPHGKTARPIATLGGSQFAWSRRGTRLAYTNKNGQIGVIKSDGTGKVALAAAKGHFPTWSPDETTIAYATRDGDINLVSQDGHTVKTLASAKAVGKSGTVVAWQP